MSRLCFVFLLSFTSTISLPQKESPVLYSVNRGTVVFHSNAQMELIRASSDKLRGLLDVQKKTFAFRIAVSSFQGFNSPLQQVHFNENYMESEKYPDISFGGKIIEDYNLSQPGTYTIRAKGILNVHGIEQERIIKSEIIVRSGSINVQSKFTVLLADHDIKIPKVVEEKLASEIMVEVKADFVPRN
ncbi:MAG: YceI family protein [Bacteroidetes bacterium]|nr:MAG: YceI family protein [Bacteroidota bacterium]